MPVVINQLTTQGWRSLTAAPPPVTSNMLVGAATLHPPLNENDSWTQVLEPQLGPMTIRRSYETESTGIPASWAASHAQMDVGKRAVCWSVRPLISQFIAGQWDAQLRTLLRSIPDDGYPKWILPWHEPDVKVRRSQYTRQQYLDASRRFGDILHAEDIPNTYMTICFSNYLWLDPAQAAGDPDLWWQPAVYDIFCVDGYYDTPAAMFGQPLAFARERNIPWSIAETGFIDNPNNTAIKAAWVTDLATYCAANGSGGWPSCVFMMWFDSDVGFEPSVAAQAFTPTSSAASIAAANTACQTHYRDPRTLILP